MFQLTLSDPTAIRPDNTAHLVSLVRRRINQFLMQEMEHTGLSGFSPSHGDIVVTLLRCGPLTMSDLARRINRDPSTVTTLVRKLSKAGYVEIRACPDDTRVKRVLLTARGRELEATFGEISLRMAQVMWQAVSAKDRETTRRVLQQIADSFADEPAADSQ